MLRNPFALVRGLPATVRILVAGTFVNKLGTFVIPFLTIVLKREFHLSSTEVGALLMAYGAGSLVAILTGGVLTDRLGRRMTLLTSLLGSGAVAYFFIAEARPTPVGPEGAAPSAPRAPSPWRDAVFLQVMAVSFAFALVFFSHITALPLTMAVNAGYPARLFGALIGTNGLLIALFEVSIVHRLRWWRCCASTASPTGPSGSAAWPTTRRWTRRRGSSPPLRCKDRIRGIVRTVAILGAGDLAATLARLIAEAELARCVVLVDANEGRAKGKALDIAQSAPVE